MSAAKSTQQVSISLSDALRSNAICTYSLRPLRPFASPPPSSPHRPRRPRPPTPPQVAAYITKRRMMRSTGRRVGLMSVFFSPLLATIVRRSVKSESVKLRKGAFQLACRLPPRTPNPPYAYSDDDPPYPYSVRTRCRGARTPRP